MDKTLVCGTETLGSIPSESTKYKKLEHNVLELFIYGKIDNKPEV